MLLGFVCALTTRTTRALSTVYGAIDTLFSTTATRRRSGFCGSDTAGVDCGREVVAFVKIRPAFGFADIYVWVFPAGSGMGFVS